jgi:hypothetical protein
MTNDRCERLAAENGKIGRALRDRCRGGDVFGSGDCPRWFPGRCRPKRWNEAIGVANLRAQSPSLAIDLGPPFGRNNAKATAFWGPMKRSRSVRISQFNDTRCFTGQSPLPKSAVRDGRALPYPKRHALSCVLSVLFAVISVRSAYLL